MKCWELGLGCEANSYSIISRQLFAVSTVLTLLELLKCTYCLSIMPSLFVSTWSCQPSRQLAGAPLGRRSILSTKWPPYLSAKRCHGDGWEMVGLKKEETWSMMEAPLSHWSLVLACDTSVYFSMGRHMSCPRVQCGKSCMRIWRTSVLFFFIVSTFSSL